MGLKLFYHKNRARQAFAIHKYLVQHRRVGKYIPKIFSKLLEINGKLGYLVEIVDMNNYVWDKFYENNPDFNIDDISDKLYNVAARKFKQWILDLQHIFCDMHDGNYGLIRGEFKWIDFSYF